MQRTISPPIFRVHWLVLSWLAGVALLGAQAATASTLRQTAIVLAVRNARPSIVNIHGRKTVRASQTNFGSRDDFRQVNGMGTGVVIDPRGYIITNYHVVEGVGRIQVTLADKRTLVGRLVAHDPKTDLAVIHIPLDDKLPVIKIGTSSDLEPGEPVVAVGNAYGYPHTVTRGIISALHRTVQVSDEQKYYDLIQTDASINPGNSGGPLLNIDGEMIGINVAVRVGAQGIGFAIPVNEALDVAAELMSVEKISGVWHGINAELVEDSGSSAAVIKSVATGSPGDQGGLKSGDVIESISKQPVVRPLDVECALLGRKSGEKVAVTIRRSGRSMTVEMVMSAAPGAGSSVLDDAWAALGMKLETMPSAEFNQLQTRYRGGLRVVQVRPRSPAAAQGIREGDVLVGMHIWETVSLENLTYILGLPELDDLQPLKFYIVRNRETLYGHLRVANRSSR